jgi:hypothetical protein
MAFDDLDTPKLLLMNHFVIGKNIFKKVSKIPPGELQDAPLVIKWWG